MSARFPTDSHTQPEKIIFPKPWSKDLQTQAKIVLERWIRFYAEITYYPLNKSITPRSDIEDFSTPVGAAGTTQFDPLWREAVPPSERSTGWQQPHGNVNHDAPDTYQYKDGIVVHAQVMREATERQLKRWGFDKVKDIVVTVPILMFDYFGVGCTPSDKFVWDGDEFIVIEEKRDGYWLNTNIRQFYVMNCERKRKGS